ncbi:hypothetical protein ABT084_05350 [Streptomyces sp. NPDC002138]|uniref:hypothetical protein n=1 Tax=Streptomyces sp. NPDC002138 TaxID=3154410 RepID=UPI0033242D9D
MSARRPLLTALGATTLLGALWFVPSAGASSAFPDDAAPDVPASANTQVTGVPTGEEGSGSASANTNAPAPQGRPALLLADTGSVDTSPYLLGGTLCLGVGAGFVVFSARRARSAR